MLKENQETIKTIFKSRCEIFQAPSTKSLGKNCDKKINKEEKDALCSESTR